MIKKLLSILIGMSIMACIVFLLGGRDVYAIDKTYYVSQSEGNNNNDGESEASPWKTLSKVAEKTYDAGDKILLKCGDTWNEELTISNSSGTELNPIIISSYGTGNKPVIRRNNDVSLKDICITVNDCKKIQISNLEICYATQGLTFNFNDTYDNDYFWIENCYFHDIYGFDQDVNDQYYALSSAINFGELANIPAPSGATCVAKNITIKDCTTYDTGTLWQYGGKGNFAPPASWDFMFLNVQITGCTMQENGFYGTILSQIKGGYMDNCRILRCGSRPASKGSAGIMLGTMNNFQVKNTEIAYQQRLNNDPDGCGVDYETSAQYTDFINCNIHHNSGVGLMFFSDSGRLQNEYCKIESCTFNQNNQNVGNQGDYEIYFSAPNSNSNGSIKNNSYYEKPDVSFMNSVDGTVSVSNNAKVVKGWEFITDTEGWTADNHIGSFAWVSDGYVNGTLTGNDPYMCSATGLGTDITNNKYIKVCMKNSTSGTGGRIFFKTDNSGWEETKAKSFEIRANDPNYTVYTIDMSDIPGWTGTLNQLRFDVINTGETSGSFSIDYIRIQDIKGVIQTSGTLLNDIFDNDTNGLPPAEYFVIGNVAVDETPGNGNRSMKMVDTGSGTSAYKTFPVQRGSVKYEVRVRADQTNGSGYFRFNNGDTEAFAVGFSGEGQIRCLHSGGSTNIMPYTAGNWYTICVEADITTHSFDVFINNTKLADQKSFENEVDMIDRFEAISWFGTGTYYVDYVKVLQSSILNDIFDIDSSDPTTLGYSVSGNVTIQDIPGSGNKSMKLADTGSGTYAYKTFPVQNGLIKYEVQVRADQRNGSCYFRLNNGGTEAFAVGFSGEGQIRCLHSGGSTDIMQYIAGNWYTIRVEADITTKKFDVYINNIKVADQKPFENPVDMIDTFEAKSWFGSGNYYVDYVKVE